MMITIVMSSLTLLKLDHCINSLVRLNVLNIPISTIRGSKSFRNDVLFSDLHCASIFYVSLVIFLNCHFDMKLIT